MVAAATGVEKGAAVALSFERRNAMVTIVPVIAEELTGQSVSGLQIASITPYQPAEGYTAIIAPSDNGFTVSVSVSGVEQPLIATTSTRIEAGKHYTFNLKVGKDLMKMETVSVAPWNQQEIGDGNAEEIPYLTFTADAEQTMKITAVYSNPYWHESMEYSVNGGKWAQLAAETDITFGGDEGTLRLRGKSTDGTSDESINHSKVSFGKSDVEVACSGDIRTLVDYANYATVSTANARFCHLFDGCTSLTTAPELPATTLAENCYGHMFYGCTSLTEAPELPATALAENCYYYMFAGCTNLTKAPELPATTIAKECYGRMFFNCTNLTKAPVLLAKTLVYRCYQGMFYDCYRLKEITMLATDISATWCLGDWVKNVPAGGTFYKNSEATWDVTGKSGIPEGWTVVYYTAPEE